VLVEKFPGEATDKRPKNSKKYRKIALLSLFQMGEGKNPEKSKKTENKHY